MLDFKNTSGNSVKLAIFVVASGKGGLCLNSY